VAPFDLVRVADLGDAWIERPFELQGALAEITAFFATVHAAGVTPLSIGGDHSISLAPADLTIGRHHGLRSIPLVFSATSSMAILSSHASPVAIAHQPGIGGLLVLGLLVDGNPAQSTAKTSARLSPRDIARDIATRVGRPVSMGALPLLRLKNLFCATGKNFRDNGTKRGGLRVDERRPDHRSSELPVRAL
jgi:hypothetical protein